MQKKGMWEDWVMQPSEQDLDTAAQTDDYYCADSGYTWCYQRKIMPHINDILAFCTTGDVSLYSQWFL